MTTKIRIKGETVRLISARAKMTYQKGKETWHQALRRSALELRREGEL